MILGIMNTVQFYEEQCNFQYMQREISVQFITAVHLYIHYVLCAFMFQCLVYIQYRTLFLVHCELQRNYWRRIQAGRRHCTPAGVSVLLLQQYTVHLLVLVYCASSTLHQYTVYLLVLVYCTSTLFQASRRRTPPLCSSVDHNQSFISSSSSSPSSSS